MATWVPTKSAHLDDLAALPAGDVMVADAAGGITPADTLPQSRVLGLPALLATLAPLASPAFVGTPTAPTPAAPDRSTALATTAFVGAQGYALDAAVVHLAGPTQFVSAATVFTGGLYIGGDGIQVIIQSASPHQNVGLAFYDAATFIGEILYAGGNAPGNRTLGWICTAADGISFVTQNATPVIFGSGGALRWEIDPDGNLLCLVDNGYDVGADGARVRNVFVRGAVHAATFVPNAPPVLSYSRAGAGETAAGAAIRQALATLGLVIDSTTA